MSPAREEALIFRPQWTVPQLLPSKTVRVSPSTWMRTAVWVFFRIRRMSPGFILEARSGARRLLRRECCCRQKGEQGCGRTAFWVSHQVKLSPREHTTPPTVPAADGQKQCLPPDSLILQCARRSRKAKVGMGGMIFEKMADTERYFPQSRRRMMRRMRLLWFLCGSERKGCGGSGGREKSGRRKGEEMEKEQGRACGFPHPDHRGNEKAALPHAGTPCQEVRQRRCQTFLHPRSKSSVPFSDPNRTEGS